MINLILIVLFSLFASSCKEPRIFDLSVSAAEGNDVTVVLSGCGEGFHDGYLFCRVVEGLPADQIITINIPKVDCERDNCALLQFFTPEGQLGFAGGFKRGENEQKVPLSKIIDSEKISKEHDNEYRFRLDIRFKDADGYEHVIETKGLVRVWIKKEGYTSLACDDPETGWKGEMKKGCSAEWSTAGRTALCGTCGKEVQKP